MPNFRYNPQKLASELASTTQQLQESTQETAQALKQLQQPLSEATRESQKSHRALLKQSEAQKIVNAGIGSLERSLFSLATGSRSAGKSVAEFGRSFLSDLLKTTLRASITSPLKNLFQVAHSGGIAGSARRESLPFFHNGGIAGLRPDDIPLIAKRGEEIITQDDPRHRNNAVAIQVSIETKGNNDSTMLQEQAAALSRAVREGALAAIEQQAARGGTFAKRIGRR